MIETVGDKRVLTDGTRTIELHHLKDSGHNTATLIAYLPKERILMYGDGYNPPAGDDPRSPIARRSTRLQLYENVQRLKLNPGPDRAGAWPRRAVREHEDCHWRGRASQRHEMRRQKNKR